MAWGWMARRWCEMACAVPAFRLPEAITPDQLAPGGRSAPAVPAVRRGPMPHSCSRRRALGGLGVVAAMLAQACRGAPGVATPRPPAAGTIAPATLVLHVNSGSVDEMLAVRLPAFQERFPQLRVEQQLFPGVEYVTKLQALAAAETLGDVAWSYTAKQFYHLLFANGVFISHDELIARDRLDLRQWYPALVEGMRVDGRLGGLPFKGQVIGLGLYYNRSLFDRAGLAYPTEQWTLDDLVEAAARLTRREGSEVTEYGMAPWALAGEYAIAHARCFDADFFSRDGRRWVFRDARALQSLRWYAEQAMQRRILGLPPGLNVSQALIQGKLASIFRGWMGAPVTFAAANRQDPAFQWGMSLTPRGPAGRRGGTMSADCLSVTGTSRARDAAWELVKWLCDRESGVLLGLQTSGSLTLGGRPDVYTDLRILEAPNVPREAGLLRARSMEVPEDVSMAGLGGGPWNLRGQELFQRVNARLAEIATGQAEPSQGFLDTLAAEATAIMEQPRLTVGR